MALRSQLGLFRPGHANPTPTVIGIEHSDVFAVAHEERQLDPGLDGFFGFESIGPFWAEWDDGLWLGTQRSRGASKARWVVHLELTGSEVMETYPAPSRLWEEGSRLVLVWRFPAGKRGGMAVRLKPPWAVQARGAVYRSAWRSTLNEAGAIPSLLFVLLVALLWRRRVRREEGGGAEGEIVSHQVRWLLVAVALFVLCSAAAWLRDDLLGHQHAGAGWWTGVEFLPVLLAVAGIGAIYWAGCRRRSPLRVLLVGVAILVVLYLGCRNGSYFGSTLRAGETLLTVPSGLLELGVLVAAAALVYAAARGLLGLALGSSARARRGHRLATIASATLTLATLATTLAFAAGLPGQAVVYYATFGLPNSIALVATTLLPLSLLFAVTGLLRRRASSDRTFLVDERELWLLVLALFVFFVGFADDHFAGFSVPLSLLLGVLALVFLGLSRRVRLERLERRLEQLNGNLAVRLADVSVLISSRRELVDRALLIERVKRLRSAAHPNYAKAEGEGEEAEAFLAYRARLGELDEAESYLQQGVAVGPRAPSRADRELVRLEFPERPRLLYPALACGPGRDWRENGLVALRYGAILATAPLAYALYLVLKHGGGGLLDPENGLEPVLISAQMVVEASFWLAAAYSFGCLYTWLPAGNGPLKGFLLSLPAIAGLALSQLCPLYDGSSGWALRSVELLFFLSLVGVLMDLRTVREVRLPWRSLFELYQLRSFRFAVLNLAPLLLSAVGIYFQIRAGDTQGALEQTLKAPGQLGGSLNGG